MAFLRVREVTCTVCGIQFPLVTGDLYVDESMVCDDCVAALWPDEDGSIRDRLSERLASVSSAEELPPVGSAEREALEQAILARMRSYVDRWASFEDLVEHRGLTRRAVGG